MKKKITPPKDWFSNQKNKEEINLFELIMSQYKDEELIFKVIKKNVSQPTTNYNSNN